MGIDRTTARASVSRPAGAPQHVAHPFRLHLPEEVDGRVGEHVALLWRGGGEHLPRRLEAPAHLAYMSTSAVDTTPYVVPQGIIPS
jgi:hypothetical protein